METVDSVRDRLDLTLLQFHSLTVLPGKRGGGGYRSRVRTGQITDISSSCPGKSKKPQRTPAEHREMKRFIHPLFESPEVLLVHGISG